eukprot:CAMPEP_0170202878 /NCGR_PEP_ID=MMETSP0116_2-20130129/929_1 /TAXON_ID=400756 /ORGANISM="Durinskia baltica, Strain CSIRO CS-38" /LENGTH=39 /DNA_ID= /DNA_START= /DNA_END= /DNA_ORIENTATION=
MPVDGSLTERWPPPDLDCALEATSASGPFDGSSGETSLE